MSTGLVVPPGGGRHLTARAQQVTFKVTGEHAAFASTFEVTVPPGFDVGAHFHTRTEELFYVLDGELEMFAFEPCERSGDDWHDWCSPTGDRPFRAGPGATLYVPPHCPHAFANPTPRPARMLFQAAPPPDHERYFDELLALFGDADEVDPTAVAVLRKRYDVHQITPLRYRDVTAEAQAGAGR